MYLYRVEEKKEHPSSTKPFYVLSTSHDLEQKTDGLYRFIPILNLNRFFSGISVTSDNTFLLSDRPDTLDTEMLIFTTFLENTQNAQNVRTPPSGSLVNYRKYYY
ncbi:hypothetical protein GZ77_01600 [Endozoicomonas montiporae]|uniref:Uncharacterized protein n=1 Tax=Endozoicomonas montiporae TaxID=1027273 RepID=A0A081NA98_9GAMM|nr:hypothetical protein [Endozoicomonas montiporae]KEQ15371.1 hypothetical protein GZ77_01600 [Endozoicomonas montiporae]